MTVTSKRKSTNLSIESSVLADARELGINVSRAAEKGLLLEIKAERERRWREENAEAIRCSNDYVERNGLPLASLRQF